MLGTALHTGLGLAAWLLAAAVPALLVGFAVGLRFDALHDLLDAARGESRDDPL